MKINREQWIALIYYFFFILLITTSSYLIFEYECDEHYSQIDDKLLSVAKGSSYLVAPDFYDRAIEADSISREEDMQNTQRLSKVAQYFHVAYIYSLIEKNGDFYFTTSSVSDDERKIGDEYLTKYFDKYDEASESVKNAFLNEETVYVEESDRWGSFRSVLVPMHSSQGKLYLSGVDIRSSELHKYVEDVAKEHLLITAVLILLSLPVFIRKFKSLKGFEAQPG